MAGGLDMVKGLKGGTYPYHRYLISATAIIE